MKNEINEPIFTRKYAQNKNETFEDMCNRVAYNDNQKNLMLQHIFMPAGRQLVARGSKLKRTLFNCYAIGFRNINNKGRDSKAAINDIEARSDEISSRGGGIGINFSVLRPKDDWYNEEDGNYFKNSFSSGTTSFIERYAFAQRAITQGGSRRGALIGILDIWHPEILKFLTMKNNLTAINNMNISPLISKRFMQAVENDDDWNLIFPDLNKVNKKKYNDLWDGNIEKWMNKYKLPVKIFKTLKARKLWHILIESAWKTGEPGILFEDNINETLNYNKQTIINTVNPCGEQILPIGNNGGGSSCNLASINLAALFNEKKQLFDWHTFDYVIKEAVKYLDSSIDEEKYFDERIEQNQKYYRQIGLGIMGYADLLILMGLQYGSDKALQFTEKLMQFMLDKAYKYSALLSKEKGNAPVYNNIKMNDYYLRKCSFETQQLVKKYKLRNSNVLSIAPTGSIAMLLGVNGGIEPYFKFQYERNDILGKRIIKAAITKKAPNKKCLIDAQSVMPEKHIKTQAVFQKYVDSSISKTVNLPKNVSLKDVENVFKLAYKSGLKGVTIYRDGCRESVLNAIKEKEKNHEVVNNNELYNLYMQKGKEIIKEGIKPPRNSFLKRTKINVGNKKYYFFTGYLTKRFEKPYEFFIVTNSYEKTEIANQLIDDMSNYLLSKGIKKEIIDAMKKKFAKQSNIDKIARLISMSLRHNVSLIDICNILEKYTESISTLLFRIRKHLMSLINNGEKAGKCPLCNSNLIHMNGCIQCENIEECGYSKC